jgi:uncharacterized lipoprotein YddW (UPF0748 family)
MHAGYASRFRGRRAARLAALCAAILLILAPPAVHAGQPAPAEVRALWVLRSSLTSPGAIETLVRTARGQGFNTLLVQVRGRADAYYASTLEPRAADLVRQPATFDPLGTVIATAHASGLAVHAWVTVNLVSSAVELPAARDHLVYQHPEWLMVPRAVAQDVAALDATNPAYVGKIARWTRTVSDTVEGLYASPLQPGYVTHVTQVLSDLAARYALDGVHLDYARYPNDQFDYSRFAIAAFRAWLRPQLTPAARAAVDEQDAIDLFAYPDRYPAEWKAFRRERMTAMVSRIVTSVRAAHPGITMTGAVYPDPAEAADVRLQDWSEWLRSGLLDAICPMAYTPDAAKFAGQIAAVREIAGARAVWAGIGAYRLTPAQTIENIQAARRLGTAGFVLFSYDSLTGPKPPAPDYLATVSRVAFAADEAAMRNR